MVRHFPVLHFPDHAISCEVVHHFPVLHFPVVHFQSPRFIPRCLFHVYFFCNCWLQCMICGFGVFPFLFLFLFFNICVCHLLFLLIKRCQIRSLQQSRTTSRSDGSVCALPLDSAYHNNGNAGVSEWVDGRVSVRLKWSLCGSRRLMSERPPATSHIEAPCLMTVSFDPIVPPFRVRPSVRSGVDTRRAQDAYAREKNESISGTQLMSHFSLFYLTCPT